MKQPKARDWITPAGIVGVQAASTRALKENVVELLEESLLPISLELGLNQRRALNPDQQSQQKVQILDF